MCHAAAEASAGLAAGVARRGVGSAARTVTGRSVNGAMTGGRGGIMVPVRLLLAVVVLVTVKAAAQERYETIDNVPSKAEIARKVKLLFDDFFTWRL